MAAQASALPRTRAATARHFAVRTVQLLCAVHLVHEHLLEIRPCAGHSMLPTLPAQSGWILQLRAPYSPLSPFPRPRPEVGQILTLASPLDPSYGVCKRVHAVPGERIGPYALPGEWEEHAPDEVRKGWAGQTVGKGQVWVLGDNPSNSTDSRMYGPVPQGLIRGRVVARIWPNPAWL